MRASRQESSPVVLDLHLEGAGAGPSLGVRRGSCYQAPPACIPAVDLGGRDALCLRRPSSARQHGERGPLAIVIDTLNEALYAVKAAMTPEGYRRAGGVRRRRKKP